jgi:Zn-dependent protease
MHDHVSWSLSLGRWGGVRVRLHMFFLLFAAFTFYLSWHDSHSGLSQTVDWLAVQILLVLLISVVLHEAGHLVAAWRMGGRLDTIVLGPLGGLTSVHGVREPRSEMVVHMAGPAANFAVCLVCVPILAKTSSGFVGLLHPLAPQGLAISGSSAVLRLLQLLLWINWSLALLNLLPVFPFDGGRAFRAAVLIKWPEAGRPAASQLVVTVAKFIAIGIFITAFLLHFGDAESVLPMRFALVLLAIFLFFSAQHEERRCAEEIENDDLLRWGEFSSDLSGLERAFSESGTPATGPLKRWMERRRELRIERQLEVEAAEERSVDEILDRLHKRGMDALSPADKALLERVSARLRSRHGMAEK